MIKKTMLALIIISFFAESGAHPLASFDVYAGRLIAGIPREEAMYSGFPVLISFNLKAPASSSNKAAKKLEFSLEPFFTVLDSPGCSTEAGISLLAKYPAGKRTLSPYFKAGVGAAYTGLATPNQRSGLNFLPQAGAGMILPWKREMSFMMEYRFRHMSNGGLRRPNSGIDADMFMAGIRFIL